jgi:hypothetical protein
MDGTVIYENTAKRQINLGVGSSPVLTADEKVALIRGRRFGYGDPFVCGRKETRNWIDL